MDDYRSVNRANWDERAPAHAKSPDYAVDRFLEDPAFISDVVRFDLPLLGDVQGKRGVHLQCHIGTDTISLARLGARMSGLDFSLPALDEARRLAVATGAEVDFVEADLYDAVKALGGGQFDLVYTGIGALCWLPDIDRWAAVVARLLRPDGRLFVREGHPMLWSLEDRRDDELLVVAYPYFRREEPSVWTDGGTYVQTDASFEHNTTHEWNHGLGEIVTALLARGLRLTGLGQEEPIQPRLVTAETLQHPYDTVLLSVKATALQQAIEDLAPAVGPRTRIIPFLNGMVHMDQLNPRFGITTVLGGVVKVATQLNADGDIVQVGPGASMTVGAQDGSTPSPLEETTAELADAGFEFSLSDDIITAMWAKWSFISTVSSLNCLMRGTIGDVVACPGGADLGPALLAEAASVAASSGHPIPEGELAATNLAVTAAGSQLTSSLYRDLQDGNPTEVDEILGDLCRRGRLADRPTPLLDLATLNIRVYEHRRSSQLREPRAA